MKKVIFGIISIIAITSGFTNPSGEKVVSGNVVVKKIDKELLISLTSKKGIINWQDFSINTDEITKFTFNTDNGAVLNRVISSNPSQIYGKLESNGKVYLVNQNGILIGKSGVIDTKGFIASTLNVSDDDFLQEKKVRFYGDSKAKIENIGKIHCTESDIYIISREIENSGEMIAKNGSVNLIAATEVLLIEKDNNKFAVRTTGEGTVVNEGYIEAIEAEIKAQGGNIFSLAINQSGIIDATGAIEQEGKVILSSADGVVSISGEIISENIETASKHIYIENTAILDASRDADGGKITIGDINTLNVYINKGAYLKADSKKAGNGGSVNVLAENIRFDGNISVQALGNIGSGGVVEFIAKENITPNGLIDTRAINGKSGKVVLKPKEVNIKHESEVGIISDTYINEQLKLSNIEIVSELEDKSIIVDSGVNIEWDQSHSLILNSKKNVVILSNATISSTSTADFVAIDIRSYSSNGNYSGIVIEKDSTLSVNSGDIVLRGNGGNISDNNYGIYLAGIIQSLGNSQTKIQLYGNTGKAESDNCGIYIKGGKIISSKGSLELYGTSLATQEFNHGIFLDKATISAGDNILINGIGAGTNSSGVYIGSCLINNIDNGKIDVVGKEAGSSGIFISPEATISSCSTISFIGNDTIYSYGDIEAPSYVDIRIGENDNGRIVIKRKIDAESVNIAGGNYNDIFYIDCELKGTIDGHEGENTLIGRDFFNTFEISDRNIGTLNRRLDFKNIQHIKGSHYNDDIFVFYSTGSLDGVIDGIGGINTLYGPNLDNEWHLTKTNSGYIGEVTSFKNIQNLIGSEKIDDFIFEGSGEITGILNGGEGYSIVDFSKYDSSLSIDLHKIINVQKIIGGQKEDILIGPEMPCSWVINNHNSGQVADIAFYDIENILSGDQNDTFYVQDNGRLDGLIDGNKGVNYLHAPDHQNIWHITGRNEGYIEGIVRYRNIQNLFGGKKQDTFVFANNSFIDGKIDGGSSRGNIIDYLDYQSSLAIDLYKIDNIQEIIGGQQSDTIFSTDVNNIWVFYGENMGELEGVLSFSNIENIVGGNSDDIFMIFEDAKISGKIDGKSGNNIIIGGNINNEWHITAENKGCVNGDVAFANINNFIGGTKKDHFVFHDDGKITGMIDGTTQKNNIIDFSQSGQSVIIDLNSYSNIQTVVGNNNKDTLVGKDVHNVWEITGENQGNLGDIKFSNIANLKGGDLTDVFIMYDEANIGKVDGGNSTNIVNIIDYSYCSNPIYAEILSGRSEKTEAIANIDAIVLPNISHSEIDKPLLEEQEVIVFVPARGSKVEEIKEILNTPVYVADDLIDSRETPLFEYNMEGKIFYHASSPYVITKTDAKIHFNNLHLSGSMSNQNIADSSIRMRNNLRNTIHSKYIAKRGNMNKATAVYSQTKEGLDTHEFNIKHEYFKECTIKQRPRALHFTPKKTKIKK